MKTLRTILIIAFTLSIASACNRKVIIVKNTPSQTLPPGHAKKLAGSQSAKAFAPGQQKKKQ